LLRPLADRDGNGSRLAGPDELCRDRLADLIARSAAPLAALLKNVSRMSGAPVAEGVLSRVVELGPGGTISPDEARRIFPDYLEAIDRLANELDRWSPA